MSVDPWLSAYGEPYDPRPAIEAWRAGQVEESLEELWGNLYHQGSVNTASYAAAGEIVRLMQEEASPSWNGYALLASIEEGRLTERNPPVPAEIRQDYERAWFEVLPLALGHLRRTEDDLVVRAALAVVAHAKGQHSLARIALCSEDEREEMLGR